MPPGRRDAGHTPSAEPKVKKVIDPARPPPAAAHDGFASDVCRGPGSRRSAADIEPVRRPGCRLQEADEGAYHEHLCSRVGIRVHYCGEQFDNDGTLSSALRWSDGRRPA
jgi:hypothetical protein